MHTLNGGPNVMTKKSIVPTCFLFFVDFKLNLKMVLFMNTIAIKFLAPNKLNSKLLSTIDISIKPPTNNRSYFSFDRLMT